MARTSLSPLLLTAVLSLALTGSALAQDVPETLSHQGRLIHDDGTPMTGEVSLAYTLYSAATAGDILWQQTVTADVDDDGFFSVEIGGGDSPLMPHLRTEEPRWLGVIVDGTSEMRPRLKLSSVPYALIAQEARTADVAHDLSGEVEIDPDVALGGLSCAAGGIARFDGSNWYCDSTDPFVVDGNISAGGNITADGRVTGESFHASSPFFEDAVMSSYPVGVSWQTGRGSEAPGSSLCRYGIVQTMYFSSCRGRQICYEREGQIFSRYLADHCEPDGPWGAWVQVGP